MNLNNKRKKRPKKQAPLWMVTYSDMVTLILVFFILLFSMSQIDAEKLKTVTESYQQRVIFDYYPAAIPLDQASNVENNEDESKNPLGEEDGNEDEEQDMNDILDQLEQDPTIDQEPDQLDRLLNEIENYLEREGLSEVITANRTDRGIVLVLQESLLFESGQAEILEGAMPFLDKVGTLLANIPNFVKVEGHTDSVPMSSYRYPSNWELSGSRASSVVRYLSEETGLDPIRFQIAGYADTRPIASNENEEDRQKNRRVEIIIMEDE
ncbi:flagellar motor protein MotS [Aquisalibacillus elongatus]|uniref:Chemotaxis protein MotB n=1 Tax=Aquisalibacillus elongatus TaxID=485577 RepID=A0A3N5BEK9_9BACI|nr:flagellar motor protein MotS [Aquisalibacillus elongatus]RPF55329.1 chemotaxis protein MotB [Aquisalibacillus elongatus]